MAVPRSRRHLLAVCAAVALVPAIAGSATAGSLSGNIKQPAGGAGKPPVRSKGFLARRENPLVPVKPVNPMPYLVIVLDKVGVELPSGQEVIWELLGESFARPLQPVISGGTVVIKNKGTRSPTLRVEEKDDLMTKSPLNPKGERAFKVGTATAAEPALLTIRDDESPYLTGSVLVLATPYFAVPDDKGDFAIADVPAGTYTVKVWYRTGWLDGFAGKTVEVGATGAVKLPLEIAAGFKRVAK